MKIIVFTGGYGAGKDYLAKKIIEKDNSFEIIKFADPLRKIISEISNEDIKNFEKDKEVKNIKLGDFIFSKRELMKIFDCIKKIYGIDVFAKMLINKLCFKKNYIITDLRFKEEYEALKEFEKNNNFVEMYYFKIINKNKNSLYTYYAENLNFDEIDNTNFKEIEKNVSYILNKIKRKKK